MSKKPEETEEVEGNEESEETPENGKSRWEKLPGAQIEEERVARLMERKDVVEEAKGALVATCVQAHRDALTGYDTLPTFVDLDGEAVMLAEEVATRLAFLGETPVSIPVPAPLPVALVPLTALKEARDILDAWITYVEALHELGNEPGMDAFLPEFVGGPPPMGGPGGWGR